MDRQGGSCVFQKKNKKYVYIEILLLCIGISEKSLNLLAATFYLLERKNIKTSAETNFFLLEPENRFFFSNTKITQRRI
jgi:hypothetical protein